MKKASEKKKVRKYRSLMLGKDQVASVLLKFMKPCQTFWRQLEKASKLSLDIYCRAV